MTGFDVTLLGREEETTHLTSSVEGGGACAVFRWFDSVLSSAGDTILLLIVVTFSGGTGDGVWEVHDVKSHPILEDNDASP